MLSAGTEGSVIVVRVSLLSLLAMTAAIAQIAGPPAPVPATRTPAEQAISLYGAEHGPTRLPRPCRPATGDTITVCGTINGRSPYRVPLPDERAPRDGPRTATGEMPRAGAGGSPVALSPGVGLTLTVPLGKAPPKITGNAGPE